MSFWNPNPKLGETMPGGLPFSQYRKSKGFETQKALAQAAGINTAMISRIENGKAGENIGDQTVNTLAKILDASPEEIRRAIQWHRKYQAQVVDKQNQSLEDYTYEQWERDCREEGKVFNLKYFRSKILITKEELSARMSSDITEKTKWDDIKPAYDLDTPDDLYEHLLYRANQKLFYSRRTVASHRSRLTKITDPQFNDDPILAGKRGPTQQEMAKRCGLSLQAYRNIEQGNADPQEVTIVMMAKAFGCEHDTFLIRKFLLGTKYTKEKNATKFLRELEANDIKQRLEREQYD